MTINEALKIAQGLKCGPLPKANDPNADQMSWGELRSVFSGNWDN